MYRARLRLLSPLLCVVSALTVRTLSAQEPAARFHAAEARWSAHRPDGTVLDDGSQAARDALAAMWSAVQQLAMATLEGEPGTTADALAKSLSTLGTRPATQKNSDFSPEISATAVKLGAGTFAVAFNDDAAGTTFIVRRSGVLWTLDTTPAQPDDRGGLLGAWQLARQGEPCRQAHHGGNPDGTCGPLTASLTPLHEDGAGHARFLLDATYSQDMGATFGKQASIWAWDGVQPRLLWIHLYAVNADQHFGMRYTDGTLEIGEKGQFRSFFACGSCDGRQLVHTLRVTDTVVQDLGSRSTVPELDALDTVFSALAAEKPSVRPDSGSDAKPIAELASAAAVATLQPLIRNAQSESAKVGPKYFTLGMLDSSGVHRQGGVAEVCLVTDSTGRLNATLEKRGGQLFLASVSHDPASKAGCD